LSFRIPALARRSGPSWLGVSGEAVDRRAPCSGAAGRPDSATSLAGLSGGLDRLETVLAERRKVDHQIGGVGEMGGG